MTDMAGTSVCTSATSTGEPPLPREASDTDALVAAAAAAAEDEDDALPAPGKVWAGPSESLATLMARHQTSTPQARRDDAAPSIDDGNYIPAVNAGDLPRVWQAMLGLLATQGTMLHSLVSQGQLVGIEEGRLVLRFSPQLETFVKAWDRNGKRDLIQGAASKVLNQPVGVKFEIDPSTAPQADLPSAQSESAVVTMAREPRNAPDSRIAVDSPATAGPRVSAAARVHAPVMRSIPRPEASPEPAAVSGLKITNELVDSLRQSSPLVNAVLDKLGGQVIKVE
jgi:hypothetical protein